MIPMKQTNEEAVSNKSNVTDQPIDHNSANHARHAAQFGDNL